MTPTADTFLSDTLPGIVFKTAVEYAAAGELVAASAAISHYLKSAPADHANYSEAQALADGLASGRIAQEQADRREMAAALAAAMAMKAEQRAASQERRRIRKEHARHLPALLREKTPMTQTAMKQKLGVADYRQWIKILRMTMAALGYDVHGHPNTVVVAAMRDYQDRQRRKQFNK